MSDEPASYFVATNLAEVLARDELLEHYRWAPGLGWLAWDGVRWAECPEEAVVEAARRWALDKLAAAVEDLRKGRGDASAVTRWTAAQKSAGSPGGLVRLARGVPGVRTDAAAFDAHLDLLNTPTGIVDLRTGSLSPSSPAALMTRCTAAGYRPGATHEDWSTALQAIPADVRDYVQLRYGQAVTGHMTPDDVLLVQQGAGENGKSSVTGAVATALGDYFTNVSDRVLLADPSAHPTELVDLRGARLALIEELPEGRQLSVVRLKKTVGTPRITARRIRQDSVTWEATHTLIVSTNYVPMVAETDHGTWRRLLLLRFPYRFRKSHEHLEQADDRRGDPHLRARLAEDPTAGEAVLSWLVDGAAAFYALGRRMSEPPQRIAEDTLAWRYESDQILSYIGDRLVLDPDAHVMATELLEDFNDWLRAHGQHAWSDKLFASRFGSHEVTNRLSKRKTRYSPKVSRRATQFAYGPAPTPLSYVAWHGVRFNPAESATPVNTGNVPSVPGRHVNAIGGLS